MLREGPLCLTGRRAVAQTPDDLKSEGIGVGATGELHWVPVIAVTAVSTAALSPIVGALVGGVAWLIAWRVDLIDIKRGTNLRLHLITSRFDFIPVNHVVPPGRWPRDRAGHGVGVRHSRLERRLTLALQESKR
jgi:hypothetical protein